jgi:hypothetical protein
LSATWLLPIALIPGSWDIEPAREPPKEIEPEPTTDAKISKPSISRTASIAKMMPSLERKASVKSSSSSFKEKKAERKGMERSTTEPVPIPKRPSDLARLPSLAGPLPTPPSSVPRTSSRAGSRSSTPPVTKSKELRPDGDRPTLKKSTSKMGLNIVWSDKPVNEEPDANAETESIKKSSNFKLPMPDVTWDHERKAAEAEAAAKLAAEQETRAAAKAKLKNKYAQALRDSQGQSASRMVPSFVKQPIVRK